MDKLKLFLITLYRGSGVEEAELKHQTFDLLLYSTMIISFGQLILSLTLEKHIASVIINAIICLIFLVLFIFNKKDKSTFMKKKLYVTYCFLIGLIFTPLMYIFGGGIQSGVPLLFILEGVTTILLLDNTLMLFVFFFNTLSAAAAIYAEYKDIITTSLFTDLTGWKSFVDISITTFFVGFGIGLFLHQLTEFFEENQNKANELLGRIENAATKDPLSGAYNRRYLMTCLDKNIQKVKDDELNTFSILMFDIDHFKQINDTYGHLAGDDCIKSLVVILKNSLRDVDIVTRYGGEEFICVLPTAEDTPAFRRAEQIRHTVEHTKLSEDIDKPITVSGGIAMYKPGMSKEELIQIADDNLYIAKESGRNQIVWHGGGIPPLVYSVYTGEETLRPVQNSGRRFSDATNKF